MPETPMDIKLKIEEIYRALCPKCQEKLLELAAQAGATDVIKRQLKEQWERK